MSSKSSAEYYSSFKEMSPIRAIAETLINNHNVRYVNLAEAYELAKKQPGVSLTDLPMYPKFAKEHGLPKDAKVIDDCHGKILGGRPKPADSITG